VTHVEIAGPFRLQVKFVDGLTGTVEMSGLIHSTHAGVFAALLDPTEFEQVGLVYGAVTWTNGLDLAPDAMYDEIKANGQWVLS
jgi:hypothetical protein